MIRRHALGRFATILVVTAACVRVNAQALAPITLDDLLLRLEANYRHYEQAVPSFICDEHLVSRMQSGSRDIATVADSNFRLRRIPSPDGSYTLDESRQVETINGQPAQTEHIQGPMDVSGAFTGDLAVVSLHEAACMHYAFEPIDPAHPEDPYIVHFESAPSSTQPEKCLLHEPATGQVLVDPENMQIVHMELTAPHHTLSPGTLASDGKEVAPITGEWAFSVDYAPVELDGETFWIPAIIRSRATTYAAEAVSQGLAGSLQGAPITVWSFRAQYNDYHKLEVSSRIVLSSPAIP